MKKALVILSGGQDSTTCLFWAKQQFDEVHAITFNYGQRHSIEIDAARKVAEMAGVASHEVVGLPNCLVSTSPLTSSSQLELYEDAEQMEKVIGDRVELTFVPMRNMLFFTVAMNRAVALGCDNLVTGICQEDNANYPDCREDFRNSFEDAANLALGTESYGPWNSNQFKILAPLMRMSKAETCCIAHEMPPLVVSGRALARYTDGSEFLCEDRTEYANLHPRARVHTVPRISLHYLDGSDTECVNLKPRFPRSVQHVLSPNFIKPVEDILNPTANQATDSDIGVVSNIVLKVSRVFPEVEAR